MTNVGTLCKSRKLEEASPLEALFFPIVAIVVITAWSPLCPPAQRGAEIPKSRFIDRPEFEDVVGFSLKKSRAAGSALLSKSHRRCDSRLVPPRSPAQRGAEIPEAGLIDRAEFEGVVGFSLRRTRAAGSALLSNSRPRCDTHLVPPRSPRSTGGGNPGSRAYRPGRIRGRGGFQPEKNPRRWKRSSFQKSPSL